MRERKKNEAFAYLGGMWHFHRFFFEKKEQTAIKGNFDAKGVLLKCPTIYWSDNKSDSEWSMIMYANFNIMRDFEIPNWPKPFFHRKYSVNEKQITFWFKNFHLSKMIFKWFDFFLAFEKAQYHIQTPTN